MTYKWLINTLKDAQHHSLLEKFKSKITVRYHFTLVRKAIIRKSTNNKCCRGYGEKGTLLHCWWECNLIQPICRTVWRFLKKKKQTKTKLPYDWVIPLLGIYPKETRTEKDTCTSMFIEALITIVRTWKQPRCPLVGEWIRKLWYLYTKEYYSTTKKNIVESVLMRWMKLEPIIEWCQKEKNKYCMWGQETQM